MPPWPVPRYIRGATIVAIPNEARQAALRSRKGWWEDLPQEFKDSPRKRSRVIGELSARRMRVRMMRHGVMFPWEEPQLPMWHMWAPQYAKHWDLNGQIRNKKIQEGMARMPDLIAEFRESRRNIRKENKSFYTENQERQRMEEAASYTLGNLRRLLDHYDESDFAWRDHFNKLLREDPDFQLPKEIQSETRANYRMHREKLAAKVRRPKKVAVHA